MGGAAPLRLHEHLRRRAPPCALRRRHRRGPGPTTTAISLGAGRRDASAAHGRASTCRRSRAALSAAPISCAFPRRRQARSPGADACWARVILFSRRKLALFLVNHPAREAFTAALTRTPARKSRSSFQKASRRAAIMRYRRRDRSTPSQLCLGSDLRQASVFTRFLDEGMRPGDRSAAIGAQAQP